MRLLRKFIHKVDLVIVACRIAVRNSDTLGISTLKSILQLYELILKVSLEGQPYMTKIGVIYPDGEKGEIATIWVGAGIASDPVDRALELLKENRELRMALSKAHLEKEEALDNGNV